MSLRAHAAAWLVIGACGTLLGGTSYDVSPWRIARAAHVATGGLVSAAAGDAPASSRAASGPARSRGMSRVLGTLDESIRLEVSTRVARLRTAMRPWWREREAWLPVLLAALADGLALQRARRCGLAPVSAVARVVSRHAVLALVCLPAAWAAWDAPAPSWAVCLWAIACATAVMHALTRVQGVGSAG